MRMGAPLLDDYRGRTPVLVDDIVSSGVTMKQAVRILSREDFAPAYCLAVHALCSARTSLHLTDDLWRRSGTSNTVPNSNAVFDVAPLIARWLVSAAMNAD